MGVVDEIQSQLVGKWALDRSENFEDAMKEMGNCILIMFNVK